jgi:threonine dehydrogenase-like Zn-dependent dehydrogenase
MRALVLEDWGKLVVAHHPDPVFGERDVLLEVIATGICGSDLHGYTGENGRRRPGQVMGHETVGRVIAHGSGVDPGLLRVAMTINPVIGCGACGRCRAGRPQLCADRTVIGVAPERPAAFAELLAVPADNLVALPSELPVEYGALVEPLAVGYHAVRRAPVRSGDTVLVIGGGPIGQACVLAAHREGPGGRGLGDRTRPAAAGGLVRRGRTRPHRG